MASLSWQKLFVELRPLLNDAASAIGHRQTILSALNRYEAQEDDFKPYLFFDESGYTKNLVDDFGDQCNVIVMCWAPKQVSAFHGHEGSKCFVKVLSGELTEQQVSYPTDVQTDIRLKSKILSRNDTAFIDDSIGLHKMINKSIDIPAVTLHIYLPAYKKCRIFDESSALRESMSLERSKTIDVTFNSVRGGHSRPKRNIINRDTIVRLAYQC